VAGQYGKPGLPPVVQAAVARDRKLAIRYRKSGGEVVDRTVDPLRPANFDLEAAWRHSVERLQGGAVTYGGDPAAGTALGGAVYPVAEGGAL
jgi:hypothetical protein